MAISCTNLVLTNKPIFLIPLLAFVTMLFMLPHGVKSANSVSFTFSRFRTDQEDLIFQGDATASNNVLQLTKLGSDGNPVTYSGGRVLYSAPVNLWDGSAVSSFETNFTFRISSPNNDPADGLTFCFLPVNSTLPPNSNGDRLGLYSTSSNNFVAVEFDTYPNFNVVEPNYRHIGIDVNSVTSRTTARWDWQNGTTATAHISYDSASKRLSVVTSYPGSEPVTASNDIDLSKVLPKWVSCGFSGTTGGFVETNTILSWSFSSSLEDN